MRQKTPTPTLPLAGGGLGWGLGGEVWSRYDRACGGQRDLWVTMWTVAPMMMTSTITGAISTPWI